MSKAAHIALAALALSAVPAGAAEFAVPKGCDAFLTVQTKSCEVALLWRCDVAPEGDHWEARFDRDGLLAITAYDAEYQWLESTFMWDGSHEMLLTSEDPISFSELLETGTDTFAFSVQRNDQDGTELQLVIGVDQLTGETTEIDGVPLELTVTEHKYLTDAGKVDYHARGQQYVSREMGLFFLGRDELIEGDRVTEFDSSPVDFMFPGDTGFGGTTPLYGCDEIKARYHDAG
ncbi:hypothetical protein [Aliiroseovarius subalbicans]|uniref:hypothetical protein n=1 Tax=Aliiroseovarius subalbicans TaxID=2925840 RepID=UPI001F58CE17|nr:hypothetical protein [Aliiroseovarius subalbicans]MCI2399949.1 hypothetical protein [Aliiroseovarius subalbicans]